MDSLDLLLLKDVAREQGEHQQHDHDKQCPGTRDLLGPCLGGIIGIGVLSGSPKQAV
jgi:hypothetical protein